MSKDIYTTQRKLNEILGIGGIEPSITNDYLNEAHEHPVAYNMHFDWTGLKRGSQSAEHQRKKIEAYKKTVAVKTYYGKPCKKAGHTERYVSNRGCIKCIAV